MRRVLGFGLVVACCLGLAGFAFARGEDASDKRSTDASRSRSWFNQMRTPVDTSVDPSWRQNGGPTQKDLMPENALLSESNSPISYELRNGVGVKVFKGSGDDWQIVKLGSAGVTTDLSIQYPSEFLKIFAKPFSGTPQISWALAVDDGNGNQNIVQLVSDPTDSNARILKLVDAKEAGKPHKITIAMMTPAYTKTVDFQKVVFVLEPCATPIVISQNLCLMCDRILFNPAQSTGLNNEYKAHATVTIDSEVFSPITISGGKAPYTVYPVESVSVVGASGHKGIPLLFYSGPFENWTSILTATAFNKTVDLTIAGTSSYTGPYPTPGTIQETVHFKVADQCGHESTVSIDYHVEYPPPDAIPLTDMQGVQLSFTTEYTDENSTLQVILFGSDGKKTISTTQHVVDGDDPTSFNVIWPLTGNFYMGGAAMLDISKVQLFFADGGFGPSMTYKFNSIALLSTYWYAINTKPWNGVANNEYMVESYNFPGDFLLNKAMVPTGGLFKLYDDSKFVWWPRAHPGDPNQL